MPSRNTAGVAGLIAFAIAGVVLLLATGLIVETIPAGHVGVTNSFGKVRPKVYGEGLHFPVMPWWDWDEYNCLQQSTTFDKISVPSRDRLSTTFDVSIQWRFVGAMASDVRQETGTLDEVVDVHLTPNARSIFRDVGNTVDRAEDFFAQETMEAFQLTVHNRLRTALADKGIEVQAVLIRNRQLPPVIEKAITLTKEREQEAERQTAELKRFKTEQQQKVAQATAEKDASEQEAIQIKLLADAKAYEIQAINAALANSPAYIQLQALSALEKMSENPATQIYFMDGSSPNPLPLMHMGVGANQANEVRGAVVGAIVSEGINN